MDTSPALLCEVGMTNAAMSIVTLEVDASLPENKNPTQDLQVRVGVLLVLLDVVNRNWLYVLTLGILVSRLKCVADLGYLVDILAVHNRCHMPV